LHRSFVFAALVAKICAAFSFYLGANSRTSRRCNAFATFDGSNRTVRNPNLRNGIVLRAINVRSVRTGKPLMAESLCISTNFSFMRL